MGGAWWAGSLEGRASRGQGQGGWEEGGACGCREVTSAGRALMGGAWGVGSLVGGALERWCLGGRGLLCPRSGLPVSVTRSNAGGPP